MEYIKLIADNYQDALFQARSEYGDNIIPINHKEIKVGGVLGSTFLSKKKVELTAAIPESEGRSLPDMDRSGKEDIIHKLPMRIKEESLSSKENKNLHAGISADADKNRLIQEKLTKVLEQKRSEIASKAASAKPDSDAKEEFLQVADKLKKKEDEKDLAALLLKKASGPAVGLKDTALKSSKTSNNELPELMDEEVDAKKAVSSITSIEKNLSDILLAIRKLENSNRSALRSFYNTALDYWENFLLESDFSPTYSEHLIQSVREKISLENQNDREEVKKVLLSILKNKIGIAQPLMQKNDKKKVAAFIGPTGVGKTTTLAKLGAIYTFYESRKVSFITVDNYRIAATEQLKRYASIINIHTHVVSEVEELQRVIREEDAELILIDTSGRSPSNREHLEDMEQLLSSVDFDIEKILVCSATAKRRDHEAVFENFGRIGIDKVILSKVDESNSFGGFIEAADKYNKAIAYLSNGQDVPSDIERASAPGLLKIFFDGNVEEFAIPAS